MYVCTFKCPLEKQDESTVPADAQQELKCTIGRYFFLSIAGWINHLKSYQQKRDRAVHENVLPACPPRYTCPTSALVCKSAGGLTSYSKIHKDVPQPAIWKFQGSENVHAGKKLGREDLRARGHAVIN